MSYFLSVARKQIPMSWGGKTGGHALYDMQADPKENHNLASNPEYNTLVRRLKTEMDARSLTPSVAPFPTKPVPRVFPRSPLPKPPLKESKDDK